MNSNSKNISIKYWSEHDRPREKLMRDGVSSLSNSELLAIVIRSGTQHESAVTLSKRLLHKADNRLHKFSQFNFDELVSFNGIGEAKALTILAALELGKRRMNELGTALTKITNSKDVFDLLQPKLGALGHEEFWIVYLNNSNGIIKYVQLSKGGITGTLVDVRLVLKTALQCGAVALILVHNHPSGNLKASNADKQLTQKIKNAAVQLDIAVLDHIIITERNYMSFADDGLL